MLMGFKYERPLAERSKINYDLYNLFIDTRLNRSSKNNDWLPQYSKNQLFKKNPIQMH